MIAFNKGEIPFLRLLLPFFAGLCLAAYFPLSGYNILLLWIFAVMMLLFITLNLSYLKLNIYKHQWIGGLLMYLLLIITGIYCFDGV